MINEKDRIDFESLKKDIMRIHEELKKLDMPVVLLLCAYLIVVFIIWNWDDLYKELKQKLNEVQHENN